MTEAHSLVTVEFYGIPRQRAGRAELTVAAVTTAEVLAAVEQARPGLSDLRRPDGRLAPHYLLSVEGRQFVTDLSEVLQPGARLLLLSADAGG
jgi:molybdopterin converting factor small subunit